MKKLFSIPALLLCMVCAFAQSANTDPILPVSVDFEGERSRILAERSREEARYQTEEAACYARFAVTDCIRKLRVQRREVLDKLRRREVVLNDAERRQKAWEQMEAIKERSSPQRLEEGALKRRDARAAQQEREQRAAQKKADALKAKSDSAVKNPGKTFEPGRSADDISRERQQYNDKLKEAQEHRLDREKDNAEKSKSSSKPLPAAH
ncbi:MAG: hypothetical protein V4713_01125 [Pseudomonadota bacterium]